MKFVYFGLSDSEWLEVMSDLEELEFNTTVLANLKFRIHLMAEKRGFCLLQLRYIN